MRWPVRLPAGIREAGSCVLDVTIVSLAVTDCRLRAGFRLAEGRGARLWIPALAPLGCRIMWSRDGQAGVEFDQRLHPAVVQHLARLYPAEPEAPPSTRSANSGWRPI